MNRKGLAEEGGALALPRAVKLADRNGLFFYYYYYYLRSRRFPAGSHLFTFSTFHFHAPALESGLMPPDGLLRLSRRDEIADVFSFLFLSPLVCYADYPQQGVEAGWRPEASRQEIFLPAGTVYTLPNGVVLSRKFS